ncbi:MAG: ATP-binding cassette domain-containing protein [Bacteroidota bacterium]
MQLQLDIVHRFRSRSPAFQLRVQARLMAGTFTALYGPSGSGKSTLLRLLAGLDRPSEGTIALGDTRWNDAAKHQHLPPGKRSVGLVFQDYALFPNLSVRQNLEFAQPKSLRDPAAISRLLEMAGLEDLASRRPPELSGGQAQRVALMRALARQPQLLLLDEAFAALDDATRERMYRVVADFHAEYTPITIMVSHRKDEVRRLAERVLVLQDGQLVEDARVADGWASG